jgi:hypothetical protein
MFGMNPFTLLRLLEQAEFQRGLAVGFVALLLVLALRRVGWLPVWGLAAVAALGWEGALRASPETPGWSIPVVAAVAGVGAWAIRRLLLGAPPWSVGGLFALWVLGVWGTVPDTERAVVTMGVAAAMFPALWPRLGVQMGWTGAPLAIGALGFVAVTDGAARASAMVGALGMVGMAVVAAAFAGASRDGRTSSPWLLIAAQALHVIVSGRVAGQMPGPGSALLIVMVSSLATGLAWAWTARSPRPRAVAPATEPDGAVPRIHELWGTGKGRPRRPSASARRPRR